MAGGEHVYATLLLSDSYLPGALVLAHSLRDAQTKVKLAVLVTLDTLSADTISQLNAVYDYILPVPQIRNPSPGNLYLMNRADLHSAFTKINLWRLIQFSKIVYIDADVVAYRAVDELFAIPHDFAAAPDIGWPDIFNTGVMVLKPNLGDYYAMIAMAERGISFDGADQGLLNMHFKDGYHRLNFTYNVTPSAHYQYVPAYRHFQSSINMVHFIGAQKPWFEGRHARHGSSPYEEMVGRWWAVYDRHYRAKEVPAPTLNYTDQKQFADFPPQRTGSALGPQTVVYHKPIHQPDHQGHHVKSAHVHHGAIPQQPSGSPAPDHSNGDRTGEHHPDHYPHHNQHSDNHQVHGDHQVPRGHQGGQGNQNHQSQQEQHQEHTGEHASTTVIHDFAQPAAPADNSCHGTDQEKSAHHASPGSSDSGRHHEEHKHEPKLESEPEPLQMSSWDAQWQPPPTDSKPEAINFPSTHYSMSQDAAPYIPPQSYPSPPKNMWYEVPKEPPAPPAQPPKPVFPWEGHQPRPSRSFPVEAFALSQIQPAETQPEAQSGENEAAHSSQADAEKPLIGSLAAESGPDPQTPPTPTVRVTPPPACDWNSFQHSNAWDEIPEIGRYVEGFQKQHRRGRSGGTVPTLASPPVTRGPGGRRSKPFGFKLTDFPTAVERPSLPVTPAPVTRSSYWVQGEGDTEEGDQPSQALPAAEGVPAQSDWNPEEQLRELARLQHAALQKLSGQGDGAGDGPGKGHRVIPKRSLPFGSEDFKSPTYVPHAPPAPAATAPRPFSSLDNEVSRSTLGGEPQLYKKAPGQGISSQQSLLGSPLPDSRT